jgi:hypothetical protein
VARTTRVAVTSRQCATSVKGEGTTLLNTRSS